MVVTRPLADTRAVARRVVSMGVVAPNPVSAITLTFTPSAAMQGLWDRYTVDRIVVNLFKDAGSYMGVVAHDPVSPTGVTTNAQVIAYANSVIIVPTGSITSQLTGHCNYMINQPTHSAADATGNLRTPLTTNQSWVAGALYCGSVFAGATAAGYSYAIEWFVTLQGPRTEA